MQLDDAGLRGMAHGFITDLEKVGYIFAPEHQGSIEQDVVDLLHTIREAASQDAWCHVHNLRCGLCKDYGSLLEQDAREAQRERIESLERMIANACKCSNRYPDHTDPEYSRQLCPIHRDNVAAAIRGEGG